MTFRNIVIPNILIREMISCQEKIDCKRPRTNSHLALFLLLGYLLGLQFNLEGGNNTFLRNVDKLKSH
jgi:hypothetical protein